MENLYIFQTKLAFRKKQQPSKTTLHKTQKSQRIQIFKTTTKRGLEMNPGLVLIATAVTLAVTTFILEEKGIAPFIFQTPEAIK